MLVHLEHANLCVYDLDVLIRFLQTAFPEFRIRCDTTDDDGSRWVHVGTDETYLALTEADAGSERNGKPYTGRSGLNHLGFEVDDIDALRNRLLTAGYEESTVPNSHPHRKRIYFYDPEGNHWEFVQYLSGDLSERHDYELPDR